MCWKVSTNGANIRAPEAAPVPLSLAKASQCVQMQFMDSTSPACTLVTCIYKHLTISDSDRGIRTLA